MAEVLQKLPIWLVVCAWVLLLVAAFAALAYGVWYLVERFEAKRGQRRGFEVRSTTGGGPVMKEEDHG